MCEMNRCQTSKFALSINSICGANISPLLAAKHCFFKTFIIIIDRIILNCAYDEVQNKFNEELNF